MKAPYAVQSRRSPKRLHNRECALHAINHNFTL